MSAGRESPRDAIRNWLAHTEQTDVAGETRTTRDEGRDGHKHRSGHRHKRRRSQSRHEANNISLQRPDDHTLHKEKISESRAVLHFSLSHRGASIVKVDSR